jgi:hypothetical protein
MTIKKPVLLFCIRMFIDESSLAQEVALLFTLVIRKFTKHGRADITPLNR